MVAVEGTVAVIWVAEFTTNVAVTLLKVTPVVVKLVPLTVPLKFVPVIMTDVPVGPKVGRERGDRGSGTGVTVKLVALVAVPGRRVDVDRAGRGPRRHDGRDRGRACVRRDDEGGVC